MDSSPDKHELQSPYSKARLARNNAIVGVGSSVALAPVTHGSSLFGLAFSGPNLVKNIHKTRKLKKEMKIHDIPKPKRRRRELLVPLGVGVAVGTFGLGVDGVADAAGGDYGLTNLFGADPGGEVTTALSPGQFALETFNGASDSIHDHISAIAAPSDAAHALGPHTAEVFNPTPSVNTASEAMAIHAVHGADMIQDWASTSQNGTFFNAKHAHELGQGLTAPAIGEGTDKGLDEGIERVPKLCDRVECTKYTPGSVFSHRTLLQAGKM